MIQISLQCVWFNISQALQSCYLASCCVSLCQVQKRNCEKMLSDTDELETWICCCIPTTHLWYGRIWKYIHALCFKGWASHFLPGSQKELDKSGLGCDCTPRLASSECVQPSSLSSMEPILSQKILTAGVGQGQLLVDHRLNYWIHLHLHDFKKYVLSDSCHHEEGLPWLTAVQSESLMFYLRCCV